MNYEDLLHKAVFYKEVGMEFAIYEELDRLIEEERENLHAVDGQYCNEEEDEFRPFSSQLPETLFKPRGEGKPPLSTSSSTRDLLSALNVPKDEVRAIYMGLKDIGFSIGRSISDLATLMNGKNFGEAIFQKLCYRGYEGKEISKFKILLRKAVNAVPNEPAPAEIEKCPPAPSSDVEQTLDASSSVEDLVYALDDAGFNIWNIYYALDEIGIYGDKTIRQVGILLNSPDKPGSDLDGFYQALYRFHSLEESNIAPFRCAVNNILYPKNIDLERIEKTKECLQEKLHWKVQQRLENEKRFAEDKRQREEEQKQKELDRQRLEDTEKLLNKYFGKQNENLYPRILIPHSIQKALTSKPELKQAERFGALSFFAGAAGLLSLATPIGWLGLLGAGAAILYDSTKGYEEREIETYKENNKVKAILSDSVALRNYMQIQIKTTLSSTQSDLRSSNVRLGKYDNTLLAALRDIPECCVKSGEGLNLSYVFTPDVIIHVPKLNLWIDVEVDEPWFLDELGQKQPIHYIGKDSYRDRQFLDANWVVVRFAEEQVAKQPKSCAKEIANFLHLFNMDVSLKFSNIPDLQAVNRWNEEEALEICRY